MGTLKRLNSKNDLWKFRFPFFILCFITNSVVGQTYSFTNRVITDGYEIQPVNNGAYCLFKASEKKAPNSVFRKVFLNQELQSIDSVSYSIEGNGNLLGSHTDENYVTHAFYSKTKDIEKIVFVVTDLTGRIQFTFFKTAADFAPCFNKSLKKIKNLRLSFIANNGNPGVLLIQPFNLRGSILEKGRILALNANDGKKLWMLAEQNISRAQTTKNLLIGLTSNAADAYYSIPEYQIAFIDKESGNLISRIPFKVEESGYRTVPVFTTNGLELMIAGSEFSSTKNKDGRFYMSLYNLSGERIFDHVDSSAVLSSKRLHMMGNVFDQEGNLILIGEGWKPDATRMVASTAASVALVLLTRGAYTRVSTAGIDHKIENLVFATLSSTDGQLKKLKTFPIGPWLTYGRLMTEENHVVFQFNNQAIIYDVNDPEIAPAPLTLLGNNESLLLTPTGPIITKNIRGRIALRRLH